jgi:anti-sigma B factor antagonist
VSVFRDPGEGLRIATLTVTACDGGPVLVVELVGELDLASIEGLQATARAWFQTGGGGGRLVLDLAGLSFCDAAGLGAIVSVRRRCLQRSGWLRLAGVSPRLRLLLEITGLDEVLSPYPSVPAAVRGRPLAT